MFRILHNVDLLFSVWNRKKNSQEVKKKSKSENLKDLNYQRKGDTFQFHMMHLGGKNDVHAFWIVLACWDIFLKEVLIKEPYVNLPIY